MPPNHGVGPNDGECLAGLRTQVTEPSQHYPVDGQKWDPTRPAPSQHNDLLSQRQVLGLERCAWPAQIDDNPQNYPAQIQHSGRGSTDSTLHANPDRIYDRDRSLASSVSTSSDLSENIGGPGRSYISPTIQLLSM